MSGPALGIDDFGTVTVTGSTLTGASVCAKIESDGTGNIGAAGNGNQIYGNTTGVEFTAGSNGGETDTDCGGTVGRASNHVDLQVDAGAGVVTVGNNNLFAGSSLRHHRPEHPGPGSDGHHRQHVQRHPPGLPRRSLSSMQSKTRSSMPSMSPATAWSASGPATFTSPPTAFIPPAEHPPPKFSAVDAASAGDTVNAQAGSYVENLNVNKPVTLIGAGNASNPATSTVISAPDSSSPVVTVSASGLDSAHPLAIERVYVSGGQYGVYFNTAASHIALDDVTIVGAASNGIEIHNNAALSDLSLLRVSSSTNTTSGVGFRIATTGTINGLSIDQSHFDNNAFGFYSNADNSSTTNQNGLTNVSITNSTFSNDTQRGIYVEKLDHATLDNITVNQQRNRRQFQRHRYQFKIRRLQQHRDSEFPHHRQRHIRRPRAIQWIRTGDQRAQRWRLCVQPRQPDRRVPHQRPDHRQPHRSLHRQQHHGPFFLGPEPGRQWRWLVLRRAPAQTLSLADTTFAASLAAYIVDFSPNPIDATAATFGSVGPADNTLADIYGVEDKIA